MILGRTCRFSAATAAATFPMKICTAFATSTGCGAIAGDWHPVLGRPLGLETVTERSEQCER